MQDIFNPQNLFPVKKSSPKSSTGLSSNMRNLNVNDDPAPNFNFKDTSERVKQKIVYGLHGAPRVLQNRPPLRNQADENQMNKQNMTGATKSVHSNHNSQHGNGGHMMQHGQMRIQSNVSNLSGLSEGHNMIPYMNSRLSIQSNNSIEKFEHQNYFTPNRAVNPQRFHGGSVQSQGAINGSFQDRNSVHSRFSHMGGSTKQIGDFISTGAFNGSNFDGHSAHNEVHHNEAH
jgi:hypothetical protein